MAFATAGTCERGARRACLYGSGGQGGSSFPSPTSRTSADKRCCREMSSCAEARFYLEGCGLTRLDGDGAGVPGLDPVSWTPVVSYQLCLRYVR